MPTNKSLCFVELAVQFRPGNPILQPQPTELAIANNFEVLPEMLLIPIRKSKNKSVTSVIN